MTVILRFINWYLDRVEARIMFERMCQAMYE